MMFTFFLLTDVENADSIIQTFFIQAKKKVNDFHVQNADSDD